MNRADPKIMTLARFGGLLEAYGGDARRWPERERAAAEAFVQSDASAAQLLEMAVGLDEQLDAFEVFEPSAHLRARVLEIPIRHGRAPARFAFSGWRIAALAILPCALGFLGGALTTDDAEQDDGWNEVAALSMLDGTVDEEWP